MGGEGGGAGKKVWVGSAHKGGGGEGSWVHDHQKANIPIAWTGRGRGGVGTWKVKWGVFY